jgi:aryl-alcohol dehydrogenase-like predicted oxidoreductase
VPLTEGPDTAKVMAVVEPIAARHGVTPRRIALARYLHRSPITLPVPGTTSSAHLKDNLATAEAGYTVDDLVEAETSRALRLVPSRGRRPWAVTRAAGSCRRRRQARCSPWELIA